jgi:hypothetical protein
MVAAGSVTPAVAQPLAPISPLAPVAPEGGAPPPAPLAGDTDRPLPAVLGAPVGVPDPVPEPAPQLVRPAQAVSPNPTGIAPERAVRGAAFGAPRAADGPEPAAPVPAALVDGAVASTAYQPPPTDPLSDLLTKRSGLKDGDPLAGPSKPSRSDSSTAKFADDVSDRIKGVFGSSTGGLFKSDHMYDGFISPVSNPFLFEDPRSLTEVRPIFIFQKIPSSQADFHGGNVAFFGTQARVAFTDQWSLVINKFGGEEITTNSPSPYHSSTGFAEIWLGPKYTFYRSEDNVALGAAGLTFQIPAGSRDVFQNTGALTLSPYASYGQNFFRDFSLGSFNFLANTGLALSTNNERSDYYWLSAHVDLDAGNLHRFYPLFELNWLLYAANGKANQIGSEGRDLINFGGQPKGSGLLTAAFGGRFKIYESAQVGLAFEIPIAGQRDLFSYRFTLDFILRY